MAIHGNKSQSARTKALADFKSGDLRVLVATDIAARGIDIDQLPHVVNFEIPNVPEDYVHRIGRTGRAGASGEAISLVCVDEEIFLRDIERLIRKRDPARGDRGLRARSQRTRRADRARPHDDRRRRQPAQRQRRPAVTPAARACAEAGASVARGEPAARHACAARRSRAARPEGPSTGPRPGARPSGSSHGGPAGARPHRGGRGALSFLVRGAAAAGAPSLTRAAAAARPLGGGPFRPCRAWRSGPWPTAAASCRRSRACPCRPPIRRRPAPTA